MFTIGELIDIKNKYRAYCTDGHNIKGGTIRPIYIFTVLIEKYTDHVRQYIKDKNLNLDYKEADISQKPFKICPIENEELIEDIKNWYEENRKKMRIPVTLDSDSVF